MNSEDQRVDYLTEGPGTGAADARLDSLRAVLADEATWAVPTHSVLDELIDRIGSERTESTRPHRWKSRLWPRFALGALAVFFIVFAWAAFLSPSATRVALAGTELEPDATGIAQVYPTGAGWSIEIDVANLPPADEGFYYEGWVWNETGDGVSIGTFHLRGGSEPVQLWAGVDVAEYPWIWITRQKEGGGAEVSDQVVMRGLMEP